MSGMTIEVMQGGGKRTCVRCGLQSTPLDWMLRFTTPPQPDGTQYQWYGCKNTEQCMERQAFQMRPTITYEPVADVMSRWRQERALREYLLSSLAPSRPLFVDVTA